MDGFCLRNLTTCSCVSTQQHQPGPGKRSNGNRLAILNHNPSQQFTRNHGQDALQWLKIISKIKGATICRESEHYVWNGHEIETLFCDGALSGVRASPSLSLPTLDPNSGQWIRETLSRLSLMRRAAPHKYKTCGNWALFSFSLDLSMNAIGLLMDCLVWIFAITE